MPGGNEALDTIEQKPPQNTDAEVSVLGSLLLDNELIGEVLEILNPEDFYLHGHQLIFEVILDLYDENRPVDQVIVCEELEKRDQMESVGGPDRVVELAESVPSTASCIEHAKLIRGKAILRRLVNVCNRMAQNALSESGDPDEILEEAERQIFKVARSREEQQSISVGDLLKDTIEQIEESREQDGLVTGIPTGLRDLDEKLGGFQKGGFIVLAGRPSMGKTSLAQTFAAHTTIQEKVPTAIFSLEMTADQIARNMLLAEAGVPPYKVKKGMIGEEEMQKITNVAGSFEDTPLYIDDSSAVSSQELRARIRRLKSKKDIELVFVDYLQMMEGPDVHSRQEEIAVISRSLKGIARELNIAVVALSQLNRQVEQRETPRPKLADLRESGAIEQDADVVMMLYRDYYYSGNEDKKGITEILITKHRNGPTGTVEVHFDQNLMRFENLAQDPTPLG